MKTTRKLIPAIAMLIVSAVMLTTASYAWFTMGTHATATGMQVTAQTASSLLIITEADATTHGGAEAAFKAATNTATFDTTNQPALAPATHDDAKTGDALTYASGLKTLEDANLVDQHTGVAGTDATWINASEDVNYIDFVAYLASAGVAMEGQTLSATVSLPLDGTLAYLGNAVSIDFWYANSADGTLTYTGKKTDLNAVNAASTKTVTLELATNMDVPVAYSSEDDSVEGDYIQVVMRVYFDGAKVDTTITDATTTYVRNSEISTANIGFGVKYFVEKTPVQG